MNILSVSIIHCFCLIVFKSDAFGRTLPDYRNSWWSNLPRQVVESNEPVRYVVTFPNYFGISKNFTFNLVVFHGNGYRLPVSFKATLKDGHRTLAQQQFTQTEYGLQQHDFSELRIVAKHVQRPSILLHFQQDALAGRRIIAAEPSRLPEQFVFIQTDKTMYKPTQTVNFCILALDRQLMSLAGEVSVTVFDAKKNKIRIWENRTLERGLFGSSFGLSDFVNFGEWIISVKTKNSPNLIEKTFAVQQYVLPKYEVKLEFPNGYLQYSTNENTYVGYIRARYTFGKPIRGKAEISLVQGCNGRRGNALIIFSVTLMGDDSNDDGKLILYGLNRALFRDKMATSCSLFFRVNVTEDLTGEVASLDAEQVNIYRNRYVLKVHDSVAKNIKPGLPFFMRFQVIRADGSQVHEPVNIVLSHHSSSHELQCSSSNERAENYINLSTDKFGIVTAVVDIPSNAHTTLFRAHIRDARETNICESRQVPQSRSTQAVSVFVDRPSNANPKVGDSLKIQITTTFTTDYVYLIVAQNGHPFVYRKLDNPIERTPSKTVFSHDVVLPFEAAPRCAVVAWAVENNVNEILADAVEFKVDGLVRQQVTASFSPSVVKPGGSTTLTVQTNEPDSVVAMFAVDKSANLLRSGNDITMEDVLGTAAAKVADSNHRPPSPVLWRCWHCGWWPIAVDASSADHVFQGVGMVIRSNAHTDAKPIRQQAGPNPHKLDNGFRYSNRQGNPRLESYKMERLADQAPNYSTRSENERILAGQVQPKSETVQPPVVRMVFPETWFWWTNITANNSNELSQTIQVPDTVTSWVFSAFAIGKNNGFGALETRRPVELTVYQPFFVNLDIPFPTVIRHEQFPIKAVVFNYQSHHQEVRLTLKRSSSFEISTDGGNTFRSERYVTTVSVPPNDGESVSLWMRPRHLGDIFLEVEGVSVNDQTISDAMRKNVTVEPEGETRYVNRPIFLKRESGNDAPSRTIINVAEMFGKVRRSQVVHGSMFFQLQAIGDLLGPTLTQLGHQVRLPTGCGEQTMVVLAPNVYIYKYLKTIGELTPDLEAKTVSFIQQGYQRELGYQRTNDGGFSAFGNNDPASSTWLTAFVIRCFNAASKHVGTSIDQNVMQRAWRFVSANAEDDGRFKDPGRIIDRAMKGGATSDINLAAYIYLTYAEADGANRYKWAGLEKTRQLLVSRALDSSVTDAYQLMIIAYAMSLLPDDRHVSMAIYDRFLADSDSLSTYLNSSTAGHRVETASYAVLALCNLGYMERGTEIARWLMAQRNSLGGFASTQDTVVGLQALAEYASKLAGIENKMSVIAKLQFADEGQPIITEFFINSTNEMLLQSFDLPRNRQDLQNVEISVAGTGVALVQLALRYNIRASSEMDSGDFDIIIMEAFNARKKRSIDNADVSVSFQSCIRAKSEQAMVGMVVAEIGVPTGYTVDLDATKQRNNISEATLLKRIETGDRKLVFYFDSLPRSDAGLVCVTNCLRRASTAVKNVQQPVAKVYSYYEPSLVKSIVYPIDAINL